MRDGDSHLVRDASVRAMAVVCFGATMMISGVVAGTEIETGFFGYGQGQAPSASAARMDDWIIPKLPEFDDGLQYRLLLDARLAFVDSPKGFFQNGEGKTRYGGDGVNRDEKIGISEAALLVSYPLTWGLNAIAYIKADAEQHRPIDVAELYLRYRSLPRPSGRYDLKLGVFFPPFSEENIGLAWNSPYGLTPSALNSWIGEELRTIGLQGRYSRKWSDHQLKLFAAVFTRNDPAGSLLAWRGWGLHNRKSVLGDRLGLATLPTFESGNAFDAQSPWVAPFREVDGRPGYYGGARFRLKDQMSLTHFYYDNNADIRGFEAGQYAWPTRFNGIGLTWDITSDWVLLGQSLWGNTKMGVGNRVDNDFSAAYLLLSYLRGPHRYSVRYDDFEVQDLDITLDDPNDEHGWAASLVYQFEVTDHQTMTLELMHVVSKRAVRPVLGLALSRYETQLQVNYRLVY